MTTCSEHSGCVAQIKYLEANVKQLWDKWDFVTKTIIAFLTTALFNLIGIIYLVIKINK